MRVFASTLLLLTALAGLAACASRDRAEAVFLHQNQVSAALAEAILAAEAEGRDVTGRLYEAEAALDAACGPLQKAGYRQFNQEALDAGQQLAAYEAVEGCEVKTSEVEALIREVDPKTAAYFLGE